MTIFNTIKSSSMRPKWAVMVLLVCFGAVALLGSPLHDHDLEPSHVDLDCISCHLVNANIGLEQDNQDLVVSRQESYSVSIKTNSALIAETPSNSSRAPPVIS